MSRPTAKPCIAVGAFALESASFLPGETGAETFAATELRGRDLISGLRGTASVGGGFIDTLEAQGAAIAPLVYADAGAAGHASDATFATYRDALCEGLAALPQPPDGVLLFLHGAMTTPTRHDPELEILRAVRRTVGDAPPIHVALDLHGNLSPEMAPAADALFGYHYSPHIDMAETGARAASSLLDALRGRIRTTTALVKVPLVLPSIFTATDLPPLRDLIARSLAREAADPEILDISIFCGFAYADVPQIGMSVVVVSDGNKSLAERVAHELAGEIWAQRTALSHGELVHDVAGGVSRAIACAAKRRRPVVLLEHADRMNDSTWVLRELIRQGVTSAAVPFLWDPQAAAEAIAAGTGADVTLSVGGRSSDRAGGPVTLTGRVRQAGNVSFVGTGPMREGRVIALGPTAVVDANGIIVSITSRSLTAIDLDAFTRFALDPKDFDIILLRSKTHFRAAYEPLVAEIIIVDTPDWGPADLTSLPYRHARPGVFPIS